MAKQRILFSFSGGPRDGQYVPKDTSTVLDFIFPGGHWRNRAPHGRMIVMSALYGHRVQPSVGTVVSSCYAKISDGIVGDDRVVTYKWFETRS